MKLWQKIFLSSLMLIILTLNIVSVILLNNSHRLIIEREQLHAINEHVSFINEINYTITNEKNILGVIYFDNFEISKLAVEIVNRQKMNTAIYYSDSESICARNMPDTLNSLVRNNFIDTIDTDGSEYSTAVFTVDGKNIMVIGSAIEIEDDTYYIVTASDISEIYLLKKQQSDFVRQVSIVASAIVSLILLVMTIVLLRPLKRLNIYTKEIAGGKYNMRIKLKGSLEFRQLAENMNSMAEAVQSHAQKLENVAEARQTFIANLAHEMKTPLTSILGFADLLRIKKHISDSDRMEYAGTIVEETKRLRSLSGKLMELITVGGTDIEKKPVSLPKIITETKTALTPLLDKNKVSLICNYESINFYADEELFKSLLYNIIENAVKASPMGEKIILNSAMYEGDAVITITDFGIGMSREDMQRVFEPFYMVDKSRSRKAGGAGLGLALCAEIAKLHNAVLEIDSKLGEGTTIFITISGDECI
ncbi:MAG: HAMP domain-containing histidine kinase [Ruminococcus flavefaciens]|nr:HAMP domain-containing histidine kinase [Ruminococcus flavefaciens]MCM1229089.1 HAMP domain-containing histidine kinase [Ruminococcus flavefaciens]